MGTDGKEYTMEPEADLADADLRNTDLRGADLEGAKLCKTTMPDGSVNNSGC